MIGVYMEGVGEVVARFENFSDKLTNELQTSVNRLTIQLQTKVRNEKLSGQVLGVRTGRGQRSIQQAPATVEGGKVVGLVSTNVFYMVGWETGWPDGGPGSGRQSLKAAKSKFDLSASSDTFKNGTPKKRAFLVPTLKEMEQNGAILTEMKDAVARASK